MVTKPTGQPRGRPAGERRDLRDDPDCFALALGSAVQVTFGYSQRRSFLIALTLLKAKEIRQDATVQPEAAGLLRRYELDSKPASSAKNEKPLRFKSEVWRITKKATTLTLTPEEMAFLKQQTRLFGSLLEGARKKVGTDANEKL
jgi:hypothetical protein